MCDDNEQGTPEGDQQPKGEAKFCRPNARFLLERRIEALEWAAKRLRGLSNALPVQLTPEADEALYSLLRGPLAV